MNSEELELSLRTEFENYLKSVFAGMRQDVADFQKNFEAEFEKHKSQLDDAIRDLSARFDSESKFDTAFTETVTEHLRLARDEGALITATAIGEAEKLAVETAPPANFTEIRDAIKEISSKTSQSAILKSLVEHAAQYTPRGAFFIVKNEHFVGWKVFGKEGHVDDAAVREIHFPIGSDTILANAISSTATAESAHGNHSDDLLFLEALEFGKPDRMYAIPLTARGRGVAVLYADYGNEGVNLNAEALETLVRVAGLTVELLANAQSAKTQPEAADIAADTVGDQVPTETHEEAEAESSPEASEEVQERESAEADDAEEYSGIVAVHEAEPETSPEYEQVGEEPAPEAAAPDNVAYFEPAQKPSEEAREKTEPATSEAATEFAFESPDAYDAGQTAETPQVPTEVREPADETIGNGHGNHMPVAAEPVVEVVTAQKTGSRLSDRQVDLPIEVADDERRLHNDARRFARLLVSEIKLYNEQKVAEGREASDLYDRLREAIDRSREMYEKRVQPPVAAKFDYFHYELVSSLADGDDEKLGGNYPGSSV